jgi:putative peptidoglycan lipid II flippase
MGAITAVSRALGLVRVLVVTAVLGVSFLGNAFQQANSVSNVLFELLAAGALSAVLVPAFVELLDRHDRAGAEQVAGGVLGVALAGLGVVTVAGVAGAPVLARLLTAAASWSPTCSCSSSPRSCCTRRARSPPRCSTPCAGSRSPPPRRSATPW